MSASNCEPIIPTLTLPLADMTLYESESYHGKPLAQPAADQALPACCNVGVWIGATS